VTPIDLATNTAGKPIDVPGEPVALAAAPDGKTAYVASGATTSSGLLADLTQHPHAARGRRAGRPYQPAAPA
jgi:DNA-binding beta-propeller fold protein YncE